MSKIREMAKEKERALGDFQRRFAESLKFKSGRGEELILIPGPFRESLGRADTTPISHKLDNQVKISETV